jgi:5'-nucleotidase
VASERRYADQQRLPISDLPPVAQQGEPPRLSRIHCNRDLRLDQIQLIGFDMDYTLAVYDQNAIDRVSIEATAQKLVAMGYPDQLLHMPFKAHFPIRGLLVDRKLGNVLKTDRYRYTKKAYHGGRELSSDERKALYQHKRIRPGTARYHSIDTLYALSEVTVYAAAVDVLDQGGVSLDYAKLFDDVRACIDEAHRDGTIKRQIVADPARFLKRDPELPETLHKLRSAGKRLFLLTNSEPEYTDALMQYLLAGGMAGYPSWRHYFDIIVVLAQKPRFFMEPVLFQRADAGAVAESFERGVLYTGGSLSEFARLTGVRGDKVLYVGDHIYGDVLRAKKESAWRTLMIIQELADEIAAAEQHSRELGRLLRLEDHRFALVDATREAQARLKAVQRRMDAGAVDAAFVELEAARLQLRRRLERLRVQQRAADAEYSELEARLDRAFHPYWGSSFKAESELSAFGEQVERYACLYTDRVTNLLHYNAAHHFRGPRHVMAHE